MNFWGIIYLEGHDSRVEVLSGDVVLDSIGADAGDVQLQLAGDALLEVGDPVRLIRTDFDGDDLSVHSMRFK